MRCILLESRLPVVKSTAFARAQFQFPAAVYAYTKTGPEFDFDLHPFLDTLGCMDNISFLTAYRRLL